jgi:hypothetical protein
MGLHGFSCGCCCIQGVGLVLKVLAAYKLSATQQHTSAVQQLLKSRSYDGKPQHHLLDQETAMLWGIQYQQMRNSTAQAPLSQPRGGGPNFMLHAWHHIHAIITHLDLHPRPDLDITRSGCCEKMAALIRAFSSLQLLALLMLLC